MPGPSILESTVCVGGGGAPHAHRGPVCLQLQFSSLAPDGAVPTVMVGSHAAVVVVVVLVRAVS